VQETFTLSEIEEVGETKMSFCVHYGQSNYPKVIFTKNLAAIKENFTKFCCFQKIFSDAPRFGCNSTPSTRAVTYTQRGHIRIILLPFTAAISKGRNATCDTAHNFPSFPLPLLPLNPSLLSL
jgi:hypothetical protein